MAKSKLRLEQTHSLETIEALSTLGDTLSLRILFSLAQGRARFTVLCKECQVSSKTLSARLKDLVRRELIVKTMYAEVPPRVEYALSEKGREFLSILQGIVSWEQGWER